NNTRMRCIGDISRLDEKLQRSIRNLEEETKGYTGLNFQIALNYGSRDEMVRAMRKMCADINHKGQSPDDITEEMFESYLDTADIPDPDLLIRTSGEQRLSNFLMWQLAYTEFYFTPVPWPEFTPEELRKAVEAYSDRDRRYGKV
ncbi:MAG: di-trans,poly-cis-decaprenylcistransferase, partial [Lachnospiraceae bacterium]|nr:di-trans,poly-cis-decaprenylcistransferase [Lachnospiraceae bacterium]